MIVRYPHGTSPTAPTNGTPYSASSSLGGGTVVYATNSGTSYTDNSLSAGNSYDYYFYTENYSYYSSAVSVSLSALSVTVDPYTYNSSGQGPIAVTGNGSGVSATWSYAGSGGTTYSASSTLPTNAGTYTATASVASSTGWGAATSSASAFTIGTATPTITVTVGTYTYSGSGQGPTAVTGNSGSGTVTWSYVGTGGTTYSASSTLPTNAGTYTATASVTANGNYGSATSSATAFSIGKVALTITAGNQSVCYGTAAATVTGAGSYTPTGFVNSETAAVIGGSATYTTTYTASTAGGTAGVTITPITSSLTATNYSFSAATGAITINALPAISSSPSGQSVGAGAGTAIFTVTATGAGLTYQWQENTGGSFMNITNGGIYSGATTATLTLTNPTSGLNGYTYRCVVSGTCTPSVNSSAATLTVTSNTITTGTIGSGTTTYCASTASVNVPFTYSPAGNFLSGGSCTFTAQLSDASGGWSSPVTLQSVVSTASSPQSISVTIPSGTSTGTGYKIRVVSNSPAVTGADNGTALTINAIPSISASPSTSTQTVCVGSSLTALSVTASGAGITYQWYYNASNSNSGGTAVSTGTGYTTSSFTPSNSTASAYYYYCVVSATCTPAVTSAVSGLITVNVLPAISASPSTSTQTVCVGSSLTALSVTASGAGITYQWYYNASNSNSGGTAVSTGTGYTTSSFTPSNSTASAYYYYCVVSGTCTPAVTSAVSGLITVNSLPAISASPSTSAQTICVGSSLTALSVTASGAGITYQWYYNASNSNSGGTAVSTGTGYTTSSFTPSNSTASAYYYYCVVSATCTPAVTSAVSGLITVNVLPAISASPSTSTQTVCVGSSLTALSVTASGAGITYQWYYNASNSNIGGTAVSTGTGYTTSNFTPSNSTASAYYYYCVVSGTCTPAVTSAVSGLVTVQATSVAGTALASAASICTGTSTTVSLSGNTGSSIQWQQSIDNSGWSTVSGGSGGTTSTYTTAALSSGLYYRAQVTNGVCSVANSSGVLVAVNTSIAGSSWNNSDNDNTNGFGAWALSSVGGYSGFFTAASGTSIDVNSESFGLWAQTSNTASAVRPLSSTMSVGQTLNFSLAYTSVPSGSSAGFSLYNSSGATLMEFYFPGGGSYFIIHDNSGTPSTAIPYTSSGIKIGLVYTSTTTYALQVTVGSTNYNFTGTLIAQTPQAPGKIRFYNYNVSSSVNFYVNSLSLNGPVITTQPTSTTQNFGVAASATALTVSASGTSLSYQWFSNTSASNSGGTSLGSGSGAQTANYTPSTLTAGTTYYYCVVSGACTSTPSNVSGAVIVTPAPIISSFTTANNNGTTTTGYVGTTVTITGTNLGSATALTVGGTNVFSNILTNNATTITFTSIAGLNGTITVTNTNGAGTSSASYADLGYITNATGNWSSTSTWLNNSVPPTYAVVTINNNVTLDQSSDTISSLSINSGKTFTASDGSARTLYINSNVNGTVTTLTNNGTWANGSGGSTIAFIGQPTVTGDAVHVVAGGTNGIIFNNVVINKSTGSTYNVGVNFGSTGTSLASGGQLKIGSGGYVSTSIPSNFYTANGSSTLQFSNPGGYNVTSTDLTWPSSNSPSAINITAGTVALNYTRTAIGSLNISGGGLTLGATLVINGSFNQTSGTFTPNSYGVTMGGSGSISVTSGISFYDLTINGTIAASSPLTVTHILTISSGNTFNDGGNIITVSGASMVNNGTHTGAGKIKLTSTSSDVTITGTGTFQNMESNITGNLSGNNYNLIVGSNFNIAGDFTISSNGVRGLTDTITFTGTGTLTENGTMFGEYSHSTLNLAFNGITTLSGTTGYIDAKNYIVGSSGKLICGNQGLNTNSTDPVKGTITINGILQTTNTYGLWDGTSNNSTIRYSGGNFQTITLGGSSTIEYNASGAQVVSKSNGIFTAAYNNLTCSNTGTKSLQSNLTIGGALTLTTSSDYLSIKGDTLTLNGAVAGSGSISSSSTSGLVIGGTAGTINFTAANDTLKTLTLNSSSSATLGSQLNIAAGVTPGIVTIGTSASLTTGGYLTLLSDSNGTARVDQVLGTVSGNVTVQRFITAKTARKYSFLGSPVNTTIRNGWQQQVYITGSGTGGAVCGITTSDGGTTDKYNSNGFDVTPTNSASMFTYNATPGSNGSRWVSIANTDILHQTPGTGFKINIRGNRNSGTVTCANQLDNASPTAPEAVTLSTTGSLVSGDVAVSLNDTSGQIYTLIANPYPSQISFSAFQAANSAINNKMWTYSPFGNGNYTTYMSGVIANGATGYDDTYGNYLAIGQAFFVEANKNGTVTFQESHKINSTIPNAKYFGTTSNSLLRVGIKTIANTLLDEAVVRFNSNGSNLYNPTWDATSFSGASQSIAVIKGGSHLAIATLPQTQNTDTIHLNVASSSIGTFKLSFSNFDGIDPSNSIILNDKFLGTNQNIRLNQQYYFNVTSNTRSVGANRFEVVLVKSTNTLPVSFTNVTAEENSKGVAVNWKVATESNIANYNVERSIDGQAFTDISVVKAIGVNDYSFEDVKPSANTTYYRIKAVGNDGTFIYSNIIKLTINNSPLTTIYPNPVQDKLNIKLINSINVTYNLKVLSISGIEVIGNTLVVASGNTITLPVSKLAAGVYTIELTDTFGNKQLKKFIKE